MQNHIGIITQQSELKGWEIMITWKQMIISFIWFSRWLRRLYCTTDRWLNDSPCVRVAFCSSNKSDRAERGCSSVVEHVHRMHEVLGSIPSVSRLCLTLGGCERRVLFGFKNTSCLLMSQNTHPLKSEVFSFISLFRLPFTASRRN